MASSEANEGQWRELAEEVLLGIKEWRLQHPKATLREIEAALDERWSWVRARLVQDLALGSVAANMAEATAGERPRCGTCDRRMEARGQQQRKLTTYYDRLITLERSYLVCPACTTGLFPPGRRAGAAAGEPDAEPAGAAGAPGELDAIRPSGAAARRVLESARVGGNSAAVDRASRGSPRGGPKRGG